MFVSSISAHHVQFIIAVSWKLAELHNNYRDLLKHDCGSTTQAFFYVKQHAFH